MYQSAGIVTIAILTIAPRIIAITVCNFLYSKLTVSEREEGGA
jgi:hypothetical protein